MFVYKVIYETVAEPKMAYYLLAFFMYSFLGYCLECAWLSLTTKGLVLNRGFASHLPFCIIYGFGALFGQAVLRPFAGNLLALFLAGACIATLLEYMVARVQIRVFGNFWWDYTEKPLNYRGILCLESTLGWGVAAIVVVRFLHVTIFRFLLLLPPQIARVLVGFLVFAYLLDFIVCARRASRKKQKCCNKMACVQAEDIQYEAKP